MDDKRARIAIIAGAAEAAHYVQKNWKATQQDIIKHVSAKAQEIIGKIDEPLQKGEEKRVRMGAIAGAAEAAEFIKKNWQSTPDEIVGHVISKVPNIINKIDNPL